MGGTRTKTKAPSPSLPLPFPPVIPSSEEPSHPFTDVQIAPLTNNYLLTYLAGRGIDAGLAKRYVQQVRYTLDGKQFTVLAFANDVGGYELRSTGRFKGTLPPKGITLLHREKSEACQEVAVFEGFSDYLSALTYYKRSEVTTPVIILNSAAMQDRAIEVIKELGAEKIHLYVCDVMDAIPKDDMGSMEHPIFSLSTKPDQRILRYEHNGSSIEITPSMKGLATIHDKDILIYCISQLIAKMNAGGELKKTLHLKAYDLLVSTNRNIDGRGYEQLAAALDRLSGTRITTNIKTNAEEVTEGFGLIASWRVVRHTSSGRMVELRVNISDWVFNAVLGGEVLTIHRDYFRLRKPLERRMYELARKHCGRQSEWVISLDLLRKKCGSVSDSYEFSRLAKLICDEDGKHSHFPDYAVSIDGENLRFINRQGTKSPPLSQDVQSFPVFDFEVYHDAKTVAPGYDVYYLEQEWREFWVDSGKPELRDAGAAFIAFCRRRYEKNPHD